MAGKFSGEVYEMARLLDLKKAEDIVLIDVSAATIVAETFLVCSGRAGNHIQMLADDLTEKMAALGIQRQRMEGYREGRISERCWCTFSIGRSARFMTLSGSGKRKIILRITWANRLRIPWNNRAQSPR